MAKYKGNRKAPAPYPFTGLIVCGHCGKNYRRKITGSAEKYKKPVWICPTFNSYGKSACPSRQIPEDILKGKANEVLGEKSIECVAQIRIPDGSTLVFVFTDGTEQSVTWENLSRSESWTAEMKAAAAEKTAEQARRKSRHAKA